MMFSLGCSMANSKNVEVKLSLSGKQYTFTTPTNYSKDFPAPKTNHYKINIYDIDLYKNPYTESENAYLIRQSHWDFGKGIFFGGVKGTLSMSLSLVQSAGENIDIAENETLISAIKIDFEKIYNKQAREEFDIKLPAKYQFTDEHNLSWAYYEYEMGQAQRHAVYVTPISDQHYLMLDFQFIENDGRNESDWVEQAEKTITAIVSSFNDA